MFNTLKFQYKKSKSTSVVHKKSLKFFSTENICTNLYVSKQRLTHTHKLLLRIYESLKYNTSVLPNTTFERSNENIIQIQKHHIML